MFWGEPAFSLRSSLIFPVSRNFVLRLMAFKEPEGQSHYLSTSFSRPPRWLRLLQSLWRGRAMIPGAFLSPGLCIPRNPLPCVLLDSPIGSGVLLLLLLLFSLSFCYFSNKMPHSLKIEFVVFLSFTVFMKYERKIRVLSGLWHISLYYTFLQSFS
jgi:hypothetical protein